MKRICIFYFPVHLIIQHENCFVWKAFWNKIAFAGHGARCLLRLTFHLYDLAFSVFVFAKLEHTYETQTIICRFIVSVLHTQGCVQLGFFLYRLLLTLNWQWILVEWSLYFQNSPKKPHSGESSGRFVPSGAVGDKNLLWEWAAIFVTSAHARPDVRNFRTSGNVWLQSLSFQDHMTKKRRALGTRMCPFKKPLDFHDSFLVG